jgi:signal transduction histidine kinase
MKDIYLAIDIAIAVGLLSLAVASLVKRGYTYSINRLFTAFSVLTALWIVSNHISNDVEIPSHVALYADYVVFSSSFGVSILLVQFVVKFASSRRLEIFVKRIMPALWVMCAMCATPLVAAGVEIQGDVYAVIFGPLLWLYAVLLFFLVGLIIYGVIHGLRYTKGIRRRQLVSIGTGLLVSVPLVFLISFVIPLVTGMFEVTEFGITPLIILVISLYYGVVRYKLFDIRSAIIRAGAYTLSLLTLAAIYCCLAYTISFVIFSNDDNVSMGISPINVLLALLLAFIFQPVKRFFDKITNKFFYRDSYDSDDFFARLNEMLTNTNDLRGLLERAADEIGRTLKSEQAFFFINTFNGRYVSAGTPHHKQLPKNDAAQLGAARSTVDDVIVATLLETNNPIRRMMVSHRIEVVLPLVQAGKPIGYLCLGEHQTFGYTNRDMKVLGTIADALTIAIQNALSIQEVKDLNENLQQRINDATKELRASNVQLQRLDKAKDEFVSMASHQLRTPLTSVKGYISMVLDGDAGKITEAQSRLLEEAFVSSERMVNLINDFLNMSRIQTGKFLIEKTPVDLSKVVKQEIDSLRPSAAARNLKFVFHAPKKFPLLYLDESKIRQVIMNFSDNALYYSRSDKPIIIGLSVEDSEILFTVKDSGIGVPKSEQAQLFTKFYRATNARKQRPDGTGVGLYLAKRVVDAHNGQIVFESTEGKGSTFGFRLPIKPIK